MWVWCSEEQLCLLLPLFRWKINWWYFPPKSPPPPPPPPPHTHTHTLFILLCVLRCIFYRSAIRLDCTLSFGNKRKCNIKKCFLLHWCILSELTRPILCHLTICKYLEKTGLPTVQVSEKTSKFDNPCCHGFSWDDLKLLISGYISFTLISGKWNGRFQIFSNLHYIFPL